MKQRKGLGRGLGALLPDKEKEKEEDIKQKAEVISSELPISAIVTNPYQPRTHFDQEALQELAESIRVQGIIQPITVREMEPGKYQLISGERRLQASKLADLKTIPAYIRTADNQQMLEMALIENIQREDLNAVEVALSYQRLMNECNLKQEELGDRVGKNRTTVNNYLRLLKLPDVIQLGLKEKTISMGHARALLGMEDNDEMVKLFQKTVTESLSVRKVEELVREYGQNAVSTPKVSAKSSGSKKTTYEFKEIQDQLAGIFGTKVQVRSDAKSKGEIKIPFENKIALEELLEKLKK